MNMDEIAKALSNNRSLYVLRSTLWLPSLMMLSYRNAENATLFYDIENERLTLYDVTGTSICVLHLRRTHSLPLDLTSSALCTLAMLNPNLTHLRLDLCGRMDDTVATAWAERLPNLKRVELLGPFLVRPAAWQSFFQAHPNLEGFLITQSPRFDVDCMRALVESCPNLKELRLKEVGKMSDEFLECIKPLGGQLTYLDISCPGTADALTEGAMIGLLEAIGDSLEYLDLSGNADVTDALLFQGIKPYALNLQSLVLRNTPDLTDAGVGEFFGNWTGAPLSLLDMSRNHELADVALKALMKHSGAELVTLSINGWKAVSEDALKVIPKKASALKKLDVGWCRCVDDWFVKSVLEQCDELEELKVWGCGRLTENCARKVRLS